MKQTDRLVIITGGTGGLGRALVEQHLQRNDQVVITSRDETKLRSLQAELERPKELHVYKLDVCDNEAVRAFAAWIMIRFGRCDILYNNAGTAVFKHFLDMSIEDVQQVMNTNVNGLFYMTRAFLPMMLAAGSGHVVTIASLAGRVATAKAALYGASKAAVIRFSEGIRYELQGSGIHVTCVLPGPIDTPLLDYADRTGLYRSKVKSYLLSPEKAARTIVRGVEAKRAEIALPKRLHYMSAVFVMLPSMLKRFVAPYMNRK